VGLDWVGRQDRSKSVLLRLFARQLRRSGDISR
jgi:hypothetical protein